MIASEIPRIALFLIGMVFILQIFSNNYGAVADIAALASDSLFDVTASPFDRIEFFSNAFSPFIYLFSFQELLAFFSLFFLAWIFKSYIVAIFWEERNPYILKAFQRPGLVI